MSDTREQSREVELTPQRKAYLWLKHNYRRPPLPVQGDCCEYDVRLDRMPQVLAEYADAELTALRSQLATLTREREEWESRRDRLLIDLGMSAKLLAAAEHRADSAEQQIAALTQANAQLESALRKLLPLLLERDDDFLGDSVTGYTCLACESCAVDPDEIEHDSSCEFAAARVLAGKE